LPFEKGYLVNWNVELDIWDRLFGKDLLDVCFDETRLLLTDPSCIVPAIKNIADEVIFETYQFASLNMIAAPTLIAMNEQHLNGRDCTIVVDSGYSFTHIVPYYKGYLVEKAVKRIDVGGKALSNQLKEWLSFRQIDVRDETYVINQCKEDACFVSLDVNHDMKIASEWGQNNTISRDYILPDFVNSNRGYLVEPLPKNSELQRIKLSVERFSLPELLFNPSDIGLQQAGIAETLLQVVSDVKNYCPEADIASNANIVCAGGNVMFPNFTERLRQELQPSFYENESFNVQKAENPVTHAWNCAQKLFRAENSEIDDGFVTRKQYLEHGSNVFLEKQKRL